MSSCSLVIILVAPYANVLKDCHTGTQKKGSDCVNSPKFVPMVGQSKVASTRAISKFC